MHEKFFTLLSYSSTENTWNKIHNVEYRIPSKSISKIIHDVARSPQRLKTLNFAKALKLCNNVIIKNKKLM